MVNMLSLNVVMQAHCAKADYQKLTGDIE